MESTSVRVSLDKYILNLQMRSNLPLDWGETILSHLLIRDICYKFYEALSFSWHISTPNPTESRHQLRGIDDELASVTLDQTSIGQSIRDHAASCSLMVIQILRKLLILMIDNPISIRAALTV